MKKKISITLNDRLLRDVDSTIDKLFIRNRSQAIEYLVEKSFKENKVAVVLAGKSKGREENPSYSLVFKNSTLIERAVRKLIDSGFKHIFIVSEKKNLTKIFNLLGDGSKYNIRIEFIEEESPEGTGSAIKLLKNRIKTTFIVVWQDIIFDTIDLKEMWTQHMSSKDLATLIIHSNPLSKDQSEKVGRIEIKGNRIIKFLEKPTNITSSIFFGGIFVAEPEIFSYYGKSLESQIFVEIAKNGLLGGYLSNQPYIHIHNKEDLKKIKI